MINIRILIFLKFLKTIENSQCVPYFFIIVLFLSDGVMGTYIGVKEVRGQVPGTTRNGHAPTVRSGLKLHKGA